MPCLGGAGAGHGAGHLLRAPAVPASPPTPVSISACSCCLAERKTLAKQAQGGLRAGTCPQCGGGGRGAAAGGAAGSQSPASGEQRGRSRIQLPEELPRPGGRSRSQEWEEGQSHLGSLGGKAHPLGSGGAGKGSLSKGLVKLALAGDLGGPELWSAPVQARDPARPEPAECLRRRPEEVLLTPSCGENNQALSCPTATEPGPALRNPLNFRPLAVLTCPYGSGALQGDSCWGREGPGLPASSTSPTAVWGREPAGLGVVLGHLPAPPGTGSKAGRRGEAMLPHIQANPRAGGGLGCLLGQAQRLFLKGNYYY